MKSGRSVESTTPNWRIFLQAMRLGCPESPQKEKILVECRTEERESEVTEGGG